MEPFMELSGPERSFLVAVPPGRRALSTPPDASEFRDSYYLLHGAERQTFWRDQLRGQPMTVGNSLMDDHVFVDRRTFEHLKSAEIVDTPEVRGLSDHAPVVVDLVLPEQAGQPRAL
jgi:exonuclease III